MTGPRTTLAPTSCGVLDVAQLAGGLPRVVDTAVVTLLESGRLQADASGRLSAVGRRTGRPVDDAVLDLAGSRPRRTVVPLRLLAPEDARLRAVAERLVAGGLLRRNPFAVLSGSLPAHQLTAAGRRVLAEWRRAPGGRVAAGSSTVAVALDGPAAMADRALRDRVFTSGGAPTAFRRRAWQGGAGAGALGWGGSSWSGNGGGGFGGGGSDGGCGGGDGGGGGC